MSATPTKPLSSAPTDASAQAQMDAFIARNREILDESIARSRAEVAEGVHDARSIDDIVAEGRKRHRAAS